MTHLSTTEIRIDEDTVIDLGEIMKQASEEHSKAVYEAPSKAARILGIWAGVVLQRMVLRNTSAA